MPGEILCLNIDLIIAVPVAESTPRFPKRARTLEFPVTMTSEQTTEGDFGSNTKQYTHSNREEESSKSILGSTLSESFHATRMSKMNESFNTLEWDPLSSQVNFDTILWILFK